MSAYILLFKLSYCPSLVGTKLEVGTREPSPQTVYLDYRKLLNRIIQIIGYRQTLIEYSIV